MKPVVLHAYVMAAAITAAIAGHTTAAVWLLVVGGCVAMIV